VDCPLITGGIDKISLSIAPHCQIFLVENARFRLGKKLESCRENPES
jgi:hypothetical protein